MWYVPNVGEREMLKDFLLSQGVVLGIYSNVVVPDGSTVIGTLVELPTGGGEGYAPVALTRDLIETLETAAKWYVSQDAAGKAKGQYGLAASPVAWVFNAVDVAHVLTAYGIFAYTWVLPFDAGSKEIKVGDTIKSAGGATGIVTAVELQGTGTWGAGTAAGYLKIMTKTGAFVNNENIFVQGEVATLNATPTVPGSGYAIGDLFLITTGGEKAVGVVLTVDGGGGVLSIGTVPAAGGRNYTTGTGKVTAKITGGGDNALTVNIAALASAAYAQTNTGAAADASKQLLAVEPFSAGKPIDTVTQQITFLPIFTYSTAP